MENNYSFIISKNNILDYYHNMTDKDKIAYVDLLYLLSGGGSNPEIEINLQESKVKKLGLLVGNKVRVFNFKREKKKGEGLPKELTYLLILWDSEFKNDWRKDGQQISAMRWLLKNYSLDVLEKIIYIYIPLGNKYPYTAKINNPRDLMYKISDYSRSLEMNKVFDEHKEDIILKVKELKEKREIYFRDA